MNPIVQSFLHTDTSTFSYVVYDHDGGAAAIIDPVLDYDAATARFSTCSADAILAFVKEHQLTVQWILETHAHADHLTAAHVLREQTGAKVAIGQGITGVQERFGKLFNLEPEFLPDGSQFDHLFTDGETFSIGELSGYAIGTPGHTDDSLTYVIGNAAFVGDTVFSPASGTARADFPGGDARKLYQSIHKLFDLPAETRLYHCHDYPPTGQELQISSSVAEQRKGNIHVGGYTSEEDYVAMRTARDKVLPAPRYILPSLQVNIRAGEMPPADANGIRYLRFPLNVLGTAK
ncbi:MBL fold metallo-hydrolase [Aquilutibacter rugosus]|uniref:MBL fold metallo-hydrolase n=1 Tax=Aquilutibacter rugosus TaxID=3115820 RepID=UPI002F4034F9